MSFARVHLGSPSCFTSFTWGFAIEPLGLFGCLGQVELVNAKLPGIGGMGVFLDTPPLCVSLCNRP